MKYNTIQYNEAAELLHLDILYNIQYGTFTLPVKSFRPSSPHQTKLLELFSFRKALGEQHVLTPKAKHFILGDKSVVYYASGHPTRPYIRRSEK